MSAAAGHPWTSPSLSKQPKPSSSGPRERIQALFLEVLLAQGAARRSRGFLQLDGENLSARAARWRKEEEEKRGAVKPAPSFGGGMPNENDTKQRSRDCPSGGGGAQVVIRMMPLEDRCPLVAVETKKINLSPPGLQLGIPASLWDFPKSSWRGRRDGAPTNTNPTGGSRPSCAQAFGVLGRFGVPPSSPSRAPASPPSPFGIFGLGV